MLEKERPRSPIRRLIANIKEGLKKTPASFIDIEDLIAHPQDFSNVKKIRTVGYPTKVDRETSLTPIIRFQNVGNNVNLSFTDWITEAIDTYRLHISELPESPSLLMVISDTTYGVGAPIEPEELNIHSSRKYSITGKVVLTKVEGDAEKYSLKASEIEPFLETRV